MEQFVSPKLVAKALGVSESSIKRWCDRGLLETVRTAGGHRRLAMPAVVQFLRQTGQKFVEPESIGLPAETGREEPTIAASLTPICEALCVGDESRVRRILFDLYLSRVSVVEICDGLLTPAMYTIGSRWEHTQLEVYQERRACEIVTRVLHEIRSLLMPPSSDAPYAMGGTLSADPYRLATAMVELSLRAAGWRAESYGTDLPLSTLTAALRANQPRLCWISVSHIADENQFLANYQAFADEALERGTAIVVGGRALTDRLRKQMRYSAFCDTFCHVVELAGTLYRPQATSKVLLPPESAN